MFIGITNSTKNIYSKLLLNYHLSQYLSQWKDPFNNHHLKIQNHLASQSTLFNRLNKLMQQQQIQSQNSSAIWIHLNKQNLQLLPKLCSVSNYNFNIHHTINNQIVLYKWFNQSDQDFIDPYSMFVVSCGALLINNNQEILLVQQKLGGRAGTYGLPGGRANIGESLQKCVERQLLQQTDLQAKYKYVYYMRETNTIGDDMVDMYFVCFMQCGQQELKKIKICQKQLKSFRWVHLNQIQDFLRTNGVKTQQYLGKYLYRCYREGFNFKKQMPNKTYKHIYTSPRDKTTRQFIQHLLV